MREVYESETLPPDVALVVIALAAALLAAGALVGVVRGLRRSWLARVAEASAGPPGCFAPQTGETELTDLATSDGAREPDELVRARALRTTSSAGAGHHPPHARRAHEHLPVGPCCATRSVSRAARTASTSPRTASTSTAAAPCSAPATTCGRCSPGPWYSWPDHVGGERISDDAFAEAGGEPRGFVLAEHPGTPPQPIAHRPVHASANGFDVVREPGFGYAGHAFVALFGDMAPAVGKVMAPVGFKVVSVDLQTGIQRDFARNEGDASGPASKLGTQGLERPEAVRFDPRGAALYVVEAGLGADLNDKPLPEFAVETQIRKGVGAMRRSRPPR